MPNTTLSPEQEEFRRGLEVYEQSLRRFMLLRGLEMAVPPEDDCPPPIIVEGK